MRTVRFLEHGNSGVLNVENVPRPSPGTDEVLIEVEAAGVNPVDTYFRDGSYTPEQLPMTPGSDFAGNVVTVGEDIEEFQPGDRVFGTGLAGEQYGSYAEYVVVGADYLAHLPKSVSFEVGAASGIACCTAWRALFEYGNLQPADRCLIHGGTGGVGHVAVQLASSIGASVAATSQPVHHERLRAFGADFALDYARSDLVDAVQVEIEEVDVVLNHRLEDYLPLDIQVAATYGRIIAINGDIPAIPNGSTMRQKDLRIQAMSGRNIRDRSVILDRIARLLAYELDIEIARTYDLTEAGEAQRAIIEDSFVGKLILDV